MSPSSSRSAAPLLIASTRYRVNTEDVPVPRRSSPSNAYWVASEAVSTARPLPWNRSRVCTLSSAFAVRPAGKAPL